VVYVSVGLLYVSVVVVRESKKKSIEEGREHD
jgi:hypothetical protein